MAADKSRRLRDLCAHVHADDGQEAKRDEQRKTPPNPPAFRDAQLAKAARRAVEQEVCATQIGIDWGTHVIDIQVSAGAHLRAWVGVACPRRDIDRAGMWLATRTPAVRAALARSITRKKAPTVTLVMEWVTGHPHGA